MSIRPSYGAEKRLDFAGISLDSCDKIEAVDSLDEPTNSCYEQRKILEFVLIMEWQWFVG